MDLIIEKLEDLKRDAERLQQTCRCGTDDAQTPPLSKRAKRNDLNGTPATPANHVPEQNGNVPSPLTLHGRKVVYYL